MAVNDSQIDGVNASVEDDRVAVGQVGRLPVLGGCWLLLGLVSVGFAFATSFEVWAPSRPRAPDAAASLH